VQLQGVTYPRYNSRESCIPGEASCHVMYSIPGADPGSHISLVKLQGVINPWCSSREPYIPGVVPWSHLSLVKLHGVMPSRCLKLLSDFYFEFEKLSKYLEKSHLL